MNRINFARVFTVLLMLVSLEAAAHRKTDVVHFYNGDRITGEIRRLESGLMTLKTDSVGTISVEWQDIAFLESEFNYDIRLTDGTRLFGSLGKAELPGDVQILAAAGGKTLQSINIVELRPVEDEWKERLDARLSLGYSYNKASGVAQTTFNTEITYSEEDGATSLTARQVHTVTDEDVTRSSKADISRAVWTNRTARFRSFWGSYEANDELGLRHRYAAGAGIGRVIRDTPRLRWMGTAGLQILTEQESDSGDEQQAVEGRLVSDFKMWQLNTPKLDLSWVVRLYPNLSDFERFRGDTDLRLSWELYKDLFWDVTAFATFDNGSETDNTSDYGITTGVSWKY